MNLYATHLPMLLKALAATSGDVLELGMGPNSTPVLREILRVQERHLLSLDNDPKYLFNKLVIYENQECQLIEDWDSAQIEKPWSVVLVDHRPAKRRRQDAIRVAPFSEYVICHDTEPENDRFYRWSKAFEAYKFCYTDKSVIPHTSVLSNFRDPSWMGNQ